MKLDYIPNINGFGDSLVRLYQFDKLEAQLLKEAIEQIILIDGLPLDLGALDFIESRNCTVVFRLSDEDEGMVLNNRNHFFCDLTRDAYLKMVKLMEPFCLKDRTSHQFLYDVDSLTDLLFSPAGTWEE